MNSIPFTNSRAARGSSLTIGAAACARSWQTSQVRTTLAVRSSQWVTSIPEDSTADLYCSAVHSSGQRNARATSQIRGRSEEHTSELQSPCNLVCRLLLEKKK